MAAPMKTESEIIDAIFDSFFDRRQNVEWLQTGLAALNYGLDGCKIRTLEITDTNARRPVPFEKASIYFGDNFKTYSLGRVFMNAYNVLDDYLQSDHRNGKINLPNDSKMRKALALILHYLENTEKEMKILSEFHNTDDKWSWGLVLAQHVFSKLSLNSIYQYDISNMVNSSLECPCSEHEKLIGYIVDTSIGWYDGWHGSLDMIAGDVPVCIHCQSDVPSRPDIASTASSRQSIDESVSNTDNVVKKNSDFTYTEYNTIISKTIASSFWNNRNNQQSITLIPSIAVNRDGIQVHFYDTVNDVLLQSGYFSLVSSYEGNDGRDIPIVNPITVLVIWMTLNYKLFCSGIVKDMPTSGLHNLIDLEAAKTGITSPCSFKPDIDDEQQHSICDKKWAFKCTVIPTERAKKCQDMV